MTKDSQRLRILCVSPWYPTETDPIPGIFVFELYHSVSQSNGLMVVNLRIDPNLPSTSVRIEEDMYGGIPTIRFWQGRGGIPKARFLNRIWGQQKFLTEMVKNFKPDIIHAATYQAAIPAVVAGRKFSVPVIETEHYSGFYLGKVQGVEKLKARWSLGKCDRVIPVSQYLLDLLEQHGIKANFEVLPIGVETSLFYLPEKRIPSDAPPRGVMVASLVPVKGYTYLLDALGILKSKGVAVIIEVAGDGPNRGMLEKKAVELGVGEMLKFRGALSKPEVAQALRDADFAITSSLGETFGAGLAEGLACGLPTVATSVGAIPELIDSSRGVLVKPADGSALANGITELISKLGSYDRSAISQWARERFSHQAIGGKFEQICHEVISERSGNKS